MSDNDAVTAPDQAHRRGRGRSTQYLNEIGLLIVILILYVVFWYSARGFLTLNNQLSILRDAATIGIAAWGATLVIISREIDVSVGPMAAFISVCLAFFLRWGWPVALAIPVAIMIGGALGAGAGILRAWFNVPSFVATLGLFSALRGLALFMTNALPVSYERSPVMSLLGRSVLGIPTSAVAMIVLFALFVFISRNTAFGRSVYAVGGNDQAARLSGINVARIRITVFMIAGLLSAVTGVFLTARLGSGNGGAAAGLEFDVIAAVVVGGTSLAGGRGSMFGTLLGVLVITLIGNGLVLVGINPFIQDVVRGAIIVVAVLLNVLAGDWSSRRRRSA